MPDCAPPSVRIDVSNLQATVAQNSGVLHPAGMLERVRDLLTSDPDPMVVSNCMSVIVKVS